MEYCGEDGVRARLGGGAEGRSGLEGRGGGRRCISRRPERIRFESMALTDDEHTYLRRIIKGGEG